MTWKSAIASLAADRGKLARHCREECLCSAPLRTSH
jgi:hypothetical protein